MKTARVLLFGFLAAAASAIPLQRRASALSFSSIVVFGDSFSDNGKWIVA